MQTTLPPVWDARPLWQQDPLANQMSTQYTADDLLWNEDTIGYSRNGSIIEHNLPLDLFDYPLDLSDSHLDPLLDELEDAHFFSSTLTDPAPPSAHLPLSPPYTGVHSHHTTSASSPSSPETPLEADSDILPSIEHPTPSSTTSSPPSRRNSSPQPTTTTSKPRPNKVTKRAPHCLIERRYRETLKTNLDRLRAVLPLSANSGSAGSPPNGSDSEDAAHTPGLKVSKATILAGAVDHIRGLERDRAALAERNARLLAEVARLHRGIAVMQRRVGIMRDVAVRGKGGGAV